MPAVVGVARWVLHIPGSRSLKMKRSVVRSMKDRLQGRFKVSVAETDHQDRWQTAELCVAFVTSDKSLADSLLSRIEEQVSSDPRAMVVERESVFY